MCVACNVMVFCYNLYLVMVVHRTLFSVYWGVPPGSHLKAEGVSVLQNLAFHLKGVPVLLIKGPTLEILVAKNAYATC